MGSGVRVESGRSLMGEAGLEGLGVGDSTVVGESDDGLSNSGLVLSDIE